MKRILFTACSLLFLLSISSRASIQTRISGKVLNKTEKPVVLLVYSFDTLRMQEVEEQYRMKIREDNSFSFVIDKISRPYTFCRIGFDNEGMKLRVSPGDSLWMEFSSGDMDSTIVFSGQDAGINRFMKEYELQFGNQMVDMEPFWADTVITHSRLSFLKEFRDRKLQLLKTSDSLWRLRPDFMRLETLRIECEYFTGLMSGDIRQVEEDTIRQELNQTVVKIFSQPEDQPLLVLREYRDFIRRYISYNLLTTKILEFQDLIDEAGTRLTGLDHTWYCFTMIYGKIQQTRNRNDKALIRDYFVKHNPDSVLVSRLKTVKIPSYSIRSQESVHDLLSRFYWFLLVVLSAVVLVIGYFGFKMLFKNQFEWKYFAFIQFAGYLAALTVLVMYAFWDYHTASPWTTILRILTMIGLASVAALYVIPEAYSRDNKSAILWKSIASSVFFAAIMLGISISEPASEYNYQQQLDFQLILILNALMFIWFWAFAMYQVRRLLINRQTSRENWNGRINGFEAIIVLAFAIALVSRSFYLYLRHQTGAPEILVLLTCLGLFLVHALWLVPKYLRDRKITNYLVGALVALAVVFITHYLGRSIGNFQRYSNLGLDPHFADVWRLSGGTLIKSVLAIQLVLVPAWLYAWIKVQLVQKSVGFKMFRNKEAELQQLRSQVNPHFLFNSLNTVYAFALKENNPKTAEYIAKLASLMRYLIEDMEKERIPAEREIEYIRDYMNLQKIRSAVEHSIEYTVENNYPGFQIAPMLMIPFVENAFKHGMNPNRISELKIHIQVQEHQFLFDIENSVDPDFTAFYKEKGFGIGIENVRQRLEYLYPGKHTIFINKQENRFRVTLTLLY